jgi:hypothetical protein
MLFSENPQFTSIRYINKRVGLSTLSLWNAALRARAVIINLTRERKGLEREGFFGIGEGEIGE